MGLIEFKHGRLRELREAHGLTVESMADKIGKYKQQVSIWECGVNSPSLENLLLICNTFDVSPAFFFGDVSSTLEETHSN